MAQPYLVARLIPEAPVDGATFSTYLENLQTPGVRRVHGGGRQRSRLFFASHVVFAAIPVLVVVAHSEFLHHGSSSPVSAPANYVSAGDYGSTLTFDSLDGISAGAFVFSTDQTTIPPSGAFEVAQAGPSNVITLKAV